MESVKCQIWKMSHSDSAPAFFDELLVQAGVSLARLAEIAGYSERTLKRVKAGEVELSDRMRRNLENAVRTFLESDLPKLEDGRDAAAPASGPRAKLQAAMKRHGITARELAKRIGYDGGSLEYCIEGRGRLKESQIEAICRVMPELTKEDLMGGSDAPLILSESGIEGTFGAKPQIVLPPGVKGMMVPLLSMAQAGCYDAAHSDDYYDYGGILALNVDDRRAFAIRVVGNSMVPRINEGDLIICSPSKKVQPGQVAVVRTKSDQAFIKFWHEDGESVVLKSANPAYEPIRFPRSEIAGAFPVVQRIESGNITSE